MATVLKDSPLLEYKEFGEMLASLEALAPFAADNNAEQLKFSKARDLIKHFVHSLKAKLTNVAALHLDWKQRQELQRLYLWYSSSKRQLPEPVIRRIAMLTKRVNQNGNRPHGAADRFQPSSDLVSNSFAVGFLSARSDAANNDNATVTVASSAYSGSPTTNVIPSMDMSLMHDSGVTEAVTRIPGARTTARRLRQRTQVQRPKSAHPALVTHKAKQAQSPFPAEHRQTADINKLNEHSPAKSVPDLPVGHYKPRQTSRPSSAPSDAKCKTQLYDEYNLYNEFLGSAEEVHTGVEYPLKTMQIAVPQSVSPYEMHFPKAREEIDNTAGPPSSGTSSKRYRWKSDGYHGSYVKHLKTPSSMAQSADDFSEDGVWVHGTHAEAGKRGKAARRKTLRQVWVHTKENDGASRRGSISPQPINISFDDAYEAEDRARAAAAQIEQDNAAYYKSILESSLGNAGADADAGAGSAVSPPASYGSTKVMKGSTRSLRNIRKGLGRVSQARQDKQRRVEERAEFSRMYGGGSRPRHPPGANAMNVHRLSAEYQSTSGGGGGGGNMDAAPGANDMALHKRFARSCRERFQRNGIKARDVNFSLVQLEKYYETRTKMIEVFYHFKLNEPHKAEALKEPLKALTGFTLMMDEVGEAFEACTFVIEDLQGRPLKSEDTVRLGIDLADLAERRGLTEDEWVTIVCFMEPPCGVKLLQPRLTKSTWMNPRYAGVDAQSFFKSSGVKHEPMRWGAAAEAQSSSESSSSENEDEER